MASTAPGSASHETASTPSMSSSSPSIATPGVSHARRRRRRSWTALGAVERCSRSQPPESETSPRDVGPHRARLGDLIGFIAGGSLRPFEHLKVRWWGLALAGLSFRESPSPAASAARQGQLAGGLLRAPRRVRLDEPAAPGSLARDGGLILNIVVIGANGGMPVSASALETAGARAEGLIGEGTAKHHVMGPEDTLTPLGDVIGIPPPIGAVISIGDVLALRRRRDPRRRGHARTLRRG